MDYFSDLISAVQSDLTINNDSTLYPLATVKLAVNRGRRKAESLFRWPKLRDAKKTSSRAGIEYYETPETWSPLSTYRLEVDGVQYGETPDGTPMVYEDYLKWRADEYNENSTDKKWARDGNLIFIYPVPTTDGTNNITMWGKKNGNNLVADGDTTIFSFSMPQCNEAIVLEAVAILKAKGQNEKGGVFRSAEAKQILASEWGKIRQEASKAEKTTSFFDVPNYFPDKGGRGGNTSNGSPIGNF